MQNKGFPWAALEKLQRRTVRRPAEEPDRWVDDRIKAFRRLRWKRCSAGARSWRPAEEPDRRMDERIKGPQGLRRRSCSAGGAEASSEVPVGVPKRAKSIVDADRKEVVRAKPRTSPLHAPPGNPGV